MIETKSQTAFWVYILECENKSLYTGYTNNLIKRFHAHLNGTASKFTRSFKPVCVAQCWPIENKSLAMRIEKYIKSLSKTDKLELINHPQQIFVLF